MNSHSIRAFGTTQLSILLIEDEQDLAQLISLNLQALDYQVHHATTLQQANLMLQQCQPDLILTDRLLPDGDGLMLCQQLRQAGADIPIIILTAKDSEADVVLGLESGADDYITKPFSVLELRARVKARLRHCTRPTHQALEFNGFTINCDTREVIDDNTQLNLTAREFDLLTFMARHPQQVFSRMQLLEAVWGLNYEGYEHTVNSHINRLRNKLANRPRLADTVKTVWGVGYKFAPPETEAVL
ncbi:DNA-binding response regulator [Shewanella sp. NFH-SH190041]|uniref:response regulator transcription factor n=1 Tax=Shewanella sp. NFH-SH190041 TaxID=2950245 RepID=UPI0021C4B0E6|nr:response regulator transcription factor [Shewanella sp. NFH-SH190041]BDM65885.1 DNA-binding response regulator [Shewanella sp. NFH-SH190041]